jgi:hypothetical protein
MNIHQIKQMSAFDHQKEPNNLKFANFGSFYFKALVPLTPHYVGRGNNLTPQICSSRG